jgi:hypothetical protein
MVVGQAELHQRCIDNQRLCQPAKNVTLEVTEVETEVEDAVAVLFTFLGLEDLADHLHGLEGDLTVDWAEGPEMRLDFEVGTESGEHLFVLPIHLHMVDFPVDADSVEEGLQPHLLEQEGIPAETA